jgi:hypothetical protein
VRDGDDRRRGRRSTCARPARARRVLTDGSGYTARPSTRRRRVFWWGCRAGRRRWHSASLRRGRVQGDESAGTSGRSVAVPAPFTKVAPSASCLSCADADGLVHVDEVAVLDPNVIVPWRLAERPIDRGCSSSAERTREHPPGRRAEGWTHHARPVTESTAAPVRTPRLTAGGGHRLTFDEPAGQSDVETRSPLASELPPHGGPQ